MDGPIIGAIIGGVFAVISSVLIIYFANKKDVERRHSENMEEWHDLQSGLRDYPLHEHTGDESPLSRANMRVRPRRS